MKTALKNIIKKTPPMKWLLGRLNKLEKAQKEEILEREASISCLKALNEENLAKINDLERTNREELTNLDKKYSEKLADLDKKYSEKLADLDEKCSGKLADLDKKYSEKLISFDKSHKEEVAKLTHKSDGVERKLKRQEDALRIEMNYLYYKGLDPSKYEEALKDWYKGRTGKTLNLEHPQTFNEKIQWMKLYDSTPLKTRLADKYLVRDWIAEKIGKEYLVPLLGVYDKFDDIDFDKLPDRFALKANHGSGWNIIVKDKAKLNMEDAKKKFDNWLKHNYAFNLGLELHYLNIPPKILIEEYLENADNAQYEYQFMCFDGEVKFILVEVDRHTNHRRVLFTPSWERMDLIMRYPPPDYEVPKPENFEKMLELVTTLSQGFAFVRVDFYNVDGKIYFGEMTFTSGSGLSIYDPEKYNKIFGDYIKLPEKSEIPRLKHI